MVFQPLGDPDRKNFNVAENARSLPNCRHDSGAISGHTERQTDGQQQPTETEAVGTKT